MDKSDRIRRLDGPHREPSKLHPAQCRLRFSRIRLPFLSVNGYLPTIKKGLLSTQLHPISATLIVRIYQTVLQLLTDKIFCGPLRRAGFGCFLQRFFILASMPAGMARQQQLTIKTSALFSSATKVLLLSAIGERTTWSLQNERTAPLWHHNHNICPHQVRESSRR